MTSPEFSFDTIKNFDKHIQQSIPDYDRLAETIISIARFYTMPDTMVADLGCSTGKLLEAIPHDGYKLGVDVSDNLLPTRGTNEIEYRIQDVREFSEYHACSLILSIFTLQFIPRWERQRILKNIYNSLVPGGAFIWAEKVIAEDAEWENINTFAHYDHKRLSFSAEQILDKERDLRRIMWPNTSEENRRLMHEAGFANGQLFWKHLNFEAHLVTKGKEE